MDLINETFETWLPVCAPFDGIYEVSNRGRVRHRWTKRLNKQTRSTVGGKPGYMKVTLRNGELSKGLSVHRLVALAFVPGDTSLDVNHKDLDKCNNLATNLEWMTHGANIRHGMAKSPQWLKRLARNGRAQRKPVYSVNATTGERTRYHSAREAAQSLGDVNKAGNIKHAIDCGSVAYGCKWGYVRRKDKTSVTR